MPSGSGTSSFTGNRHRKVRARVAVPGAPTQPLGQVNNAGVLPWAAFGWVDQLEHVPDLVWPASVRTYSQMRTDSQVNGLYLGITLPIRRYKWVIKPNGASDEIVQGVSDDFNLPIQGDDDKPQGRLRGKFSWDDHLRQALLAIAYGFYYFEEWGQIDNTGMWRLKALAPRTPGTITQVQVADDGSLDWIKQSVGVNSPVIPGNRLVPYCWDREGGNWFGKSMFRQMYKHWLIKDRLMRVDAMKHDRTGVGVPFIEAPPGASTRQLEYLQEIAQAWRAGDQAGVAAPSGSKMSLVGTTGTIPDTVASMTYHDEAMARSLLMMFIQLGQTMHGSRALGDSFIDFFTLAQETIALWVSSTFNATAVEDWVNWNYGEDELDVPRLVHERNPEPDLAVADLVAMVAQGIIHVDPELEAYLRGQYLLPEMTPAEAALPAQLTPPQPSNGVPPVKLPPEVTTSVVSRLPTASPQPQPDATLHPVAVRRKRTVMAGVDSLLPLPNRALRRQPYEQEVRAQVDFAAMDSDMDTALTALVHEVKGLQPKQIKDLQEQIVAAGENVNKLSAIAAEPIFSKAIQTRMVQIISTGAAQAITEASRQGTTIAMPDLAQEVANASSRAIAVDAILARSISEAAARKALALTGGSLTPEQVASETASYLSNLSTSYLQDQLGGTLMQAMNSGRKAVMDDGGPTGIYASELLDSNTCEPCTDIDGTEYPDLQAAEADYPTGGYMDCLGGPRCRGTLVATYGEEEPSA